jgi:hypothetical protein
MPSLAKALPLPLFFHGPATACGLPALGGHFSTCKISRFISMACIYCSPLVRALNHHSVEKIFGKMEQSYATLNKCSYR